MKEKSLSSPRPRALALGVLLTALAMGRGAFSQSSHEHTRLPLKPGRPVELEGEIVDLSSYLRDGRHGPEAKADMLTALKNGAPLAVLDLATETVYLVAAETPATDPNDAVRDYVADPVHIQGTVYERAGSKLLVVDKIERRSP